MTAASWDDATAVPESLDRLVRYLAQGSRRSHSCGHFDDARRASFLCAQHPELGVMCRCCGSRHASTHSEQMEFTCDVCGRSSRPIHPAHTDMFRRVEMPTGWERWLTTVCGLGMCSSCAGSAARSPEAGL
jgi:hypothetical protein